MFYYWENRGNCWAGLVVKSAAVRLGFFVAPGGGDG
jgi:hypothetical protein